MNKLISANTMMKNASSTLNKMRIKDETMKPIIVISLVVMLLLITGCAQVTRAPQNNNLSIVGSGNVVSQTRSLSGFDTLEAGLSFELSIRQGEEFSVVFVADDNLLDYLAAEKIGTTLNFDLKDGYTYDISNVTMRVEVTMPELSRLNLNGSSRAHLEGFQSTQPFEATLTGSSSLSGEIQAETANINANGSTFVKLSSTGHNLWVDACGKATVDLNDYRVEDATLQISCASR